MKYQVIRVSATFSFKKGLNKLIKEVNEAMNVGWEPIGGVTLAGTELVQAMVKKR